MCLNCGCGQLSNTHGDPLNITVGRFRLIAMRNNSTLKKQAVNIIATLLGYIKADDPRGDDEIEVRVTRTRVEPPKEAKHVERIRLTKKRVTKKST